jgi:cytochrome d ubiquinol oxidase subunit I
LTVWAWVLWARGKLYESSSFLRAANGSVPLGYIAVTAGWFTTEVGRQPWVVYGYVRTADAVTPSLTGGDVALSLFVYTVVYVIIFGAGFYYLLRLVQRGMPADLPESRPDERPAQPFSTATRS